MHATLNCAELVLLTDGGRRFDLRWRGRSVLGTFHLAWDYSGSHDQIVHRTSLHPPIHLAHVAGDSSAPGTGQDAPVGEGRELRIDYGVYAGARGEVRLTLTEEGLEITQSLRYQAVGDRPPMRVEAFRVVAPDPRGSWLDGVGEEAGWRFFPLGYSSFSPSFAQDSTRVVPVPPYRTAGTFNQYTASPYWGKWSDLSTPWMAVVSHPQRKVGVLLGWVGARAGVGEVALRRRHPTLLEMRLDFGGRQVPADAIFTGDALRIAPGSHPDQLLDQWITAAGVQMKARVPEGTALSGWCSWYTHSRGVTEEHVHGALQSLALERGSLPVRIIQLDDGYQRSLGDWLRVNEKFPSGLADLAQRILAEGFLPGIWTAPFLVQRSSEIFKNHPDWLLRAPDGMLRRLGYHPVWGVLDGQVYALDPSHPGVLAYLAEVYSTLRAMGYGYFKIDFLFAGLQPGRHYDPTLSPVEAYRKGLECIRTAVGDCFLLGCGAPLLPSIGQVDGMRISSDVKERWTDPLIGALARGAGHPSAELALLNSITRSPLHRRWWINDPDCLLVRDQGSSLKEVEVRTLVTVLSLTGGMLFLGDRMEALSAARRRLAALALPPLGASAAAPGLLEHSRPGLFVRMLGQTGDPEGALVAMVNWSEEMLEGQSTPESAGLPLAAYHAFDFWSETYRRLAPGEGFPVTLDPHETALIQYRAVRDVPQIVSASHHVGQLSVLLKEEQWSSPGRLRIALSLPAHREGFLWIAEPDPYRLESVSTEGDIEVLRLGRFSHGSRIQARLTGEGTLLLHYRSLRLPVSDSPQGERRSGTPPASQTLRQPLTPHDPGTGDLP